MSHQETGDFHLPLLHGLRAQGTPEHSRVGTRLQRSRSGLSAGTCACFDHLIGRVGEWDFIERSGGVSDPLGFATSSS